MAKASDNVFPKLLLAEGTTPATPAAGNHGLFVDSTDGLLKRVDDAGVVSTVEGSGGGGGSAATVHRDTLASDFTTTVNGTYTPITGLTFSLTPAVDGILMLNSRVRARSSATVSIYLRAVISPAPLTGAANIGAAHESAAANKRFTYHLVGGWGLDGGTAYTVTVEAYQAGAGTFTVDSDTAETELLGIFTAT